MTSAPRCFPKRHRLTRSDEYQRVFGRPRKSISRNLSVFARGNGLSCPRLGLIIAKRSVKGAVARSRLKRIVRESFRHHREALPALDIIVMARHGLDGLPNREVYDALAKHWAELAQWEDA